MTTQLLPNEYDTVRRQTPASQHDSPHAATVLVLRATAIVLLMGIAVIHLVQLVPTFQQTPALGVAFVLLIAGAVLVGARLVKGHGIAIQLWLPVAALSASAVLGYAFTRLFSSPLDRVDVGNWACELGLAALFVEGVLVAMALYAISLHWNAERTELERILATHRREERWE